MAACLASRAPARPASAKAIAVNNPSSWRLRRPYRTVSPASCSKKIRMSTSCPAPSSRRASLGAGSAARGSPSSSSYGSTLVHQLGAAALGQLAHSGLVQSGHSLEGLSEDRAMQSLSSSRGSTNSLRANCVRDNDGARIAALASHARGRWFETSAAHQRFRVQPGPCARVSGSLVVGAEPVWRPRALEGRALSAFASPLGSDRPVGRPLPVPVGRGPHRLRWTTSSRVHKATSMFSW